MTNEQKIIVDLPIENPCYQKIVEKAFSAVFNKSLNEAVEAINNGIEKFTVREAFALIKEICIEISDTICQGLPDSEKEKEYLEELKSDFSCYWKYVWEVLFYNTVEKQEISLDENVEFLLLTSYQFELETEKGNGICEKYC